MKIASRILTGMAMFLFILGGSSIAAAKERMLLGTSSVGGTYYVLGGAWAKLINEKIPEVDISVEVTGGPATNIPLITSKDMELGFLTTWLAGEGYTGSGAWTGGKKFDEVRAVFPMYASILHIFTLENMPIQSIQDFAGKHAGSGPPGSTSDLASKELLKSLGIKVAKHSSIPTGTMINSMRDGNCDAGFAVTGTPGPFMIELESTHAVRHLSLSQDDLAKILKDNPYWSTGVIPTGTYKHQKSDTNVIAFWNIAAAHKDVNEDLVYKITKATFEGRDALIMAAPDMKQSLPENILKSTIPLHKGALKYYREVGVQIPDGLIPPEAK